jgi:hypothetical protein
MNAQGQFAGKSLAALFLYILTAGWAPAETRLFGNIQVIDGPSEILEVGDEVIITFSMPFGPAPESFSDDDFVFALWRGGLLGDLEISHGETTWLEGGFDGIYGQFKDKSGINPDFAAFDFLADQSIGSAIGGSTVLDFGAEFQDVDRDLIEDPGVLVYLDAAGWDVGQFFVDFANSDGQVWVISGEIDEVITTGSADDYDGDGVPNDQDNCLFHSNPLQQNADGDLQGDACDICAFIAEYPPFDSDRDGIFDACDLDMSAGQAIQHAADSRVLQALVASTLGGPEDIEHVIELNTPEMELGPGEDLAGINRSVTVRGVHSGGRTVIRRASDAPPFRGWTVNAGGYLVLENIELQNFRAEGEGDAGRGGAVRINPGGGFSGINIRLTGNSAAVSGGAISFAGNGHFSLFDSEADANSAPSGGFIDAKIFTDGFESGDVSSWHLGRTSAKDNQASVSGCGLLYQRFAPYPDDSELLEWVEGIGFSENCPTSKIAVAIGDILLRGNSVESVGESGAALHSGDAEARLQTMLGSYIQPGAEFRAQQSPDSGGKATPEDVCGTGGGGSVDSLGHNLSSDDTCNLDHPSDLPDTDPMLGPPDGRGIRTPLPGSPMIDHGPAELVQFDGASWPSLPCGWKDIYGRGRPQDGDGDGSFECDIGAVEAQGAGQVVAGHSGAYYNIARNGEGQYVEVLDDARAVIYTFTWRPDGTGPAWFIGLADIVGNALVASELLRPVGTRFGSGFDTSEIWFAPWGGMSMVFPDCTAIEAPGNIAFSGSGPLGYMPLLTSATRLTHVAGCGVDVMPAPNAGLSGSFYDPARNGEGVIVQWLPNGKVLAILFTYDLAGNQMWVFGTGVPDGMGVTIDALYPTGFAAWGTAFDPGDVALEPWGTFTLDYSDCNNLVFSFDSMVPGYGHGMHNYTRLTNLAGLTCPAF